MKRVVFLVALIASAGCSSAAFDASGFARPHAGYRIGYADAARHHMLSSEWRVDNYALRPEDERPGRKLKTSSSPDLVLRHRSSHAVIWAESFDLGASNERTALEVLAENWVASIATKGYFRATTVSPGAVEYRDRRFAAEILDARPVGLHGAPAYAVMIDVANLNQAEITPDSRSARALVFFVRLPHPRKNDRGHARGVEPLLLVAGYANAPDAFEDSVADFEAFLSSIEFVPDGDRRGAAARD